MKTSSTFVLALFMLIGSAAAQTPGEKSTQELLAAAKFTGACGMANQLIDFQATARMDGGDEFVVRFLTTEAARLGKTPVEYMTLCASSIKTYDSAWDAAGGGR